MKMNIQIITSSYPLRPDDPKGAAGLFVRDFALELSRQGHYVLVQPVSRSEEYQADPGLVIEPLPWWGGNCELASMNFFNPLNWFIFLHYFIAGSLRALKSAKGHHIDRLLCMWVIPSGIFGYWVKKRLGISYDVWALGSDIWRIRKVPILGKCMLRKIISQADRVWADGLKLADDVKEVSDRECSFLPSNRKMPPAQGNLLLLEPCDKKHLLFVGRYHPNKGPDILIEAISLLPEEIKKKIMIHMFGVGPLESSLRESIGRLNLFGIIRFNGPIQAQEFSNYLSRVDYLIISSRIESIPVVFSDALQMGVPVVATPVGDLPRLINNLRCGFVATKVEPLALAQAIESSVLSSKVNIDGGDFMGYFNIEHNAARWVKHDD